MIRSVDRSREVLQRVRKRERNEQYRPLSQKRRKSSGWTRLNSRLRGENVVVLIDREWNSARTAGVEKPRESGESFRGLKLR